jgi:hypothetical protein
MWESELDLTSSREGSTVGVCEHGDESSGSKQPGNVLIDE